MLYAAIQYSEYADQLTLLFRNLRDVFILVCVLQLDSSFDHRRGDRCWNANSPNHKVEGV